MLGQRRRQWANIDLILFPEFYKQTIKKTIKKMKSRVVDEGCGSRGEGVEGVFEISVCDAGRGGNQRCKLVQRLISLLGIYG